MFIIIKSDKKVKKGTKVNPNSIILTNMGTPEGIRKFSTTYKLSVRDRIGVVKENKGTYTVTHIVSIKDFILDSLNGGKL